jgi:hypothetical protein
MANVIDFPTPEADCPKLFSAAQRAALMGLASRVAGGEGGRVVAGLFSTPMPMIAGDYRDEDFSLMPGGWPGDVLGSVYFLNGPGRTLAFMTPSDDVVATSDDVAEIVRAAERRLGFRVAGGDTVGARG